MFVCFSYWGRYSVVVMIIAIRKQAEFLYVICLVFFFRERKVFFKGEGKVGFFPSFVIRGICYFLGPLAFTSAAIIILIALIAMIVSTAAVCFYPPPSPPLSPPSDTFTINVIVMPN